MNRIESTSSQFWFLTECPLFSGIVGHFRLFLFKSLFRFLTTLFFINLFFFQERRIKLILWFYDLYDGEYCSFFIFILDHQTHTHSLREWWKMIVQNAKTENVILWTWTFDVFMLMLKTCGWSRTHDGRNSESLLVSNAFYSGNVLMFVVVVIVVVFVCVSMFVRFLMRYVRGWRQSFSFKFETAA